MTTSDVDWRALEFACVHEAKVLPKPDPEQEEWYKEANMLFKAGVNAYSEDLLQKSFALMLKAAEAGHIKAMNNVVVAYLDGDGVRINEDKAVEWAEKLIERNIGMGYYHMGVFLEQGIGVKQDRKAALAYFRKSADLGNPQGQLVVGNKILLAVGQSPEMEMINGYAIGTAMLKCSLTQGLREAGYELGFHYGVAEKKPVETLLAFQAAARLGHNESIYILHSIFRDGDYGVSKDEVRAACYERIWQESNADKSKTFPNIDRICPLPPKPMPRLPK